MPDASTKHGLRETFNNSPLAAASYVTRATILVTLIIFTFLAVGITAHHGVHKLGQLLQTASGALELAVLSIGLLIVGGFTWVAPYVFTSFGNLILPSAKTPTGVPDRYDLSKKALLPALLVVATVWFSPLWNGLLPGGSIAFLTGLPPHLTNNVWTFGFIFPPAAAVYSLFIEDEQASEDTPTLSRPQKTTTGTATSDTSTSTPSTRQQANTSTKNQGETSPNASNVEPPDVVDPSESAADSTVSYEYNWQTDADVSFDDIGGMDDVKGELTREIIAPLRGDIEKYEAFGIGIPNVLLYGPPGTGKTYLAEGLAGELGFPHVQLSAGDVLSKWVNDTPGRVSRLFNEAEALAEKHGYAIVFIDEIDALLVDRKDGRQHQENKKVVDEFLAHLSKTSERRILFIGATNHLRQLDDAAIRAGRIDKKINVPLPDHAARSAIMQAQLRSRPGGPADPALVDELAAELDGATAADISKIVQDAARYSVEANENRVTEPALRRAVSESLT